METAPPQMENTENTLTSELNAPPPTVTDTVPEASDVTAASSSTAKEAPMPPIRSGSPSLPPPGRTAPVAANPAVPTATTLPPIMPHPHSFHAANGNRGKMNGVPLSLNQLAIVAASQNKLPTSRVKGIVMRMGRHTQSSAKKLGRWYKGDHYVDPANYSWRNMELFIDYQKQMYTPVGTIKASCKK